MLLSALAMTLSVLIRSPLALIMSSAALMSFIISSHYDISSHHITIRANKGQLAARYRALGTMITKKYHGIQKAAHPFGCLFLGSGGPQFKTRL